MYLSAGSKKSIYAMPTRNVILLTLTIWQGALQKLPASDKFVGGGEYFNIASGKLARISEMLTACIELSGR